MIQKTSAQSGQMISIVVACFNAVGAIEKTLTSIISQDYPYKEIVLIDGKSVDGTWSVVQKYRDQISFAISERDEGIPDAYNKGIAGAKGDWIYFLNADDVFADDNILSEIFSTQLNFKDIDVLTGSVLSTDGRLFNGRFSWWLLIKNTVHHQAIFYRAKFLKSHPFNSSYRTYGHDHEHNLWIWKRKIRVQYLNRVVAIWARGGVSDIPTWKTYKEEFKVRRNTVGIFAYLFNAFTLLRFVLKYARSKLVLTQNG
jgi:glycosyltransferase involved in cell wall biosynthesis